MGILLIAIINLVICGVPFMMVYFDNTKTIANPTQAILLTCGIGLVSWFFIAMYYSMHIQRIKSDAKYDKEALDFWQAHPEYNIIQPIIAGGKWSCEHPTKDSMCFGKTLRELMNTIQECISKLPGGKRRMNHASNNL